MDEKYTCIDLFAGAGGLSEGFLQSGKYSFLAHVEWESPMVDTLRNNLVKRWGYSEEKAKDSVMKSWDEYAKNSKKYPELKEYRKGGKDRFVYL